MKKLVATMLVFMLCCVAGTAFARSGELDPMTDLGAGFVTAAQGIIKTHLSYPLTAKFLTLYKWAISYNDSTYIVTGKVTYQNAFGVPKEEICTVWFTYEGGNTATPFFTIIGDRSWFE